MTAQPTTTQSAPAGPSTWTGTITIDDAFFDDFGKRMYSMSTYAVLCRELLQNARDATLAGGRIRIETAVSYERADDGNYYASIVCDDTGCGMSEDTLRSVFLRVGGTLKGEGSTGGYGIAKVALFSCRRGGWSVHTRSSYMDQTLAGWDVRARQGTRVEARPHSEWTWQQREGASIGEIMLRCNDVSNLWLNGVKVKPYKPLRFLGAGYYGDDHGCRYEVATAPRIRLSDGSYLSNLYIYRINGLVQYCAGIGEDIGSNVVIDFSGIDYRPRASNYPFNMSRESMQGYETRRAIEDLVRPLIRSRNTAKRRAAEDEEDTSRGGKLRKTRIRVAEGGYLLMDAPTDQTAADRKAARQITALWTALVRLYDPEAWSGQCYGPMGACHTEYQDRPAYLINPGMFALSWEHGDNPMAVVIGMWHLATHEFTHSTTPDHDEAFTSAMWHVGMETVAPLVEHIGALRITARKCLDSIQYFRDRAHGIVF